MQFYYEGHGLPSVCRSLTRTHVPGESTTYSVQWTNHSGERTVHFKEWTSHSMERMRHSQERTSHSREWMSHSEAGTSHSQEWTSCSRDWMIQSGVLLTHFRAHVTRHRVRRTDSGTHIAFCAVSVTGSVGPATTASVQRVSAPPSYTKHLPPLPIWQGTPLRD